MNKFIKVLLPLVLIICDKLSYIGYLIPKKDNLFICGAMAGNFYGDNSRYVYEYINSHRPELECVWLTRNKNICEKLKAQNMPVCYMYSLKSIWLLFRSSLAFYTNNLADIALIPTLAPKSLSLFALRHGRSVKRVRFAADMKLSFAEKYMIHKETKMIRGAASTSSFISSLQEQVLAIGKNKHYVTGYPRNDVLKSGVVSKKIGEIKGSYDKVFLYGPTWRHGGVPVQFFPFSDFELDKLSSFLIKTNSLLILRAHKNEMKIPSVVNKLKSLSQVKNIIVVDHNAVPSVNDLLTICDCLLCDYSALYHDFLLVDKPLIMIPYDYDEIAKVRGFLYDYKSLSPGPVVDNFDDVLKYLSIVANGSDFYEQQRRKLTRLIHDNVDDHSTERVVELALKIKNL